VRLELADAPLLRLELADGPLAPPGLEDEDPSLWATAAGR